MGRKKRNSLSGLRLRNGIWHIEKLIYGTRIYESTGSSNQEEAERFLAHRIEQMRQAQIYGIRPKRLFIEAATKYLLENQHKRSIAEDALHIETLKPYIGHLDLEKINMFHIQPFIDKRLSQGLKNRTINYSLQVTRRILNLAHQEWTDEFNLSWLSNAPKIKLLPLNDSRTPYPMTWEEQDRLFNFLPIYLRQMALFKVNTGLRNQEVCRLRWEWEYPIPELNTSVFVIPGEFSKNGLNRLVVLNSIAIQVITEVRDQHPVFVFPRPDGKSRIGNMNSRAWKKARQQSNIPVRVHDLKHTFGRRLRAANVSLEDRQDLLGHKSHRITTHYSSAEIAQLINAANKVCCRQDSTPTITVIRKISSTESQKPIAPAS